MPTKIYLVRHAESTHNVSKDFSLRDPQLTVTGIAQAAQLLSTFPNPASIAVVYASPLRRAIQTALAGFPHVLDRRYYNPNGEGGWEGVDGGVDLVLDPDLQERSDLPCDTGSEVQGLREVFPGLDLNNLGDEWLVKKGRYAADDETVEQRARAVRRRLGELALRLEKDGGRKSDVVVVLHGVFMKFLSQDKSIDLPKAGWKAFTAVENSQREWDLIAAE